MNPTLTLSDTAVALSGTVRATVVLPGPAMEPAPLLTSESAAAWEVTPAGPPTLDAGKWSRVYILEPLTPGEAVPVRFNPFTVNGTAVDIPVRTMTVTTSVTDRTAAAARPPAGYEAPPLATPANYTGHVAAFAALAVAAVFTVIARRRKRPTARALASNAYAAAEAALSAAPFSAAAFAVALSRAVRAGVPGGEHRTTAELSISLQEPLLRVLEECDRVKFAGVSLTPDAARGLLDISRTAAAAAA